MAARKTTKRRRPRRGTTIVRQLASLRRARHAIAYLRQGYTYEAAAEFTGFKSRQSCWYAVMRLLATEREEALEAARELIELQRRRLDQLLQGIMPKAVMTGDPALIDTTLRVLDRIARLNGFDKPMKFAPTNPDGDEPAPVTAVLDIGAALAKVRDYEVGQRG